MKNTYTFLLCCLIFSFVACVPARKYEELKTSRGQIESERNNLLNDKKNLEADNTEMKRQIQELNRAISGLQQDTNVMGISLAKMTTQYDKINRLNDELVERLEMLKTDNEKTHSKLMTELDDYRDRLLKREDGLQDLERELGRKEANLENANAELLKRENMVKELKALLEEKDRAASELKEKVSKALLGFADKGLSIEQKDGKIYVSMEAKLLFDKGSTLIDTEGKKALVELAKVLVQQDDLTIIVEGHTDSDKMAGSGAIKDNWDLSALRSTSVIRILTDQGVKPDILSAAGRGEYIPLFEETSEAEKSKNRRIEIILSPNLDQVFKILEN